MYTDDFKLCRDYLDNFSNDLLDGKSREYATEDRLHNFKAAAALRDIAPTEALGGMMLKHTVSIYDMIRWDNCGDESPLRLWREKLADHINYLRLLWALLVEREMKKYAPGDNPDVEPLLNVLDVITEACSE